MMDAGKASVATVTLLQFCREFFKGASESSPLHQSIGQAQGRVYPLNESHAVFSETALFDGREIL